MRMTKGFLALTLTIALAVPCVALPATALGQSAGDEQYVDPFQGGGGSNNDNSQSDNSNSGGEAQDQGTTTTTTQTTESGDTAGVAESDSQTLPRTGLPLAGLVLSGAALLGGGAALRRRA
jgi:hypothetical protein